MLYKFKSDAGGDVIMLEATGGQVLEIIGKGFDAKGILLPEQMASAKAAIEAAIALEEQAGKTSDEPEDKGNKRISLRTRAWPLVMLMERSAKDKVPITWGV
ncbi:MAG: DUF1840 domain-containing protein [Burkholderiales bacterium]|nr:MAG: DUF1840 domain-containing protein [Burkholderiales bacterium]